MLKHKLVLLRHGESQWNLENRFTGWTNVGLTKTGIIEAKLSGQCLKTNNFIFDQVYTSVLKRAIQTMEICIAEMNLKNIPVKYNWRLNERHYGELTGLNKDQMIKILGKKKVHAFRRAWDMSPPPLSKKSQYHPLNIKIYRNIPKDKIPDTESLKKTYKRVITYYLEKIEPLIQNGQNVLISAHGNTLRALCKKLLTISDKNRLISFDSGPCCYLSNEFIRNKIMILIRKNDSKITNY